MHPMTETAQDTAASRAPRPVLVSAATGYIGSHMLRPLVRAGYRVRASARSPQRIDAPDGVEVVQADALDADAVRESLAGIHTAFYLVHMLGGGAGYAERDTAAATIFADADNSMRVCQDEIFGPVLTVVHVDTYEEAVQLTNSHEYGNVLWPLFLAEQHGGPVDDPPLQAAFDPAPQVAQRTGQPLLVGSCLRLRRSEPEVPDRRCPFARRPPDHRRPHLRAGFFHRRSLRRGPQPLDRQGGQQQQARQQGRGTSVRHGG